MITAMYTRNYKHNGIEIRFSGGVPEKKIRERLLCNKWRYLAKEHYWYTYYTPNNLSFAKELCSKFSASTSNIKGRKTEKAKMPSDDYDKKNNNYNSIQTCNYVTNANRKRTYVDEYTANKYAEAKNHPLGQYIPISPKDDRYKRKRSFFS